MPLTTTITTAIGAQRQARDGKTGMKQIIGLLSLAILISQCAGMSAGDSENFRAEVNKSFHPGMGLNAAQDRFSALGFSCDPKSMAPEITCTRVRHGLASSCIDRVNLTADPEHKTVSSILAKAIVCTGL